MKIALLEDDIDTGAIIKLWLESAGHECEHYETGEQFIDNTQGKGFDLYILDWMLPDISGIDVLRWLRDNVGWDTPVLFVTARDSEEDIVHALETGADDYMVKPVKQNELLARITALHRRIKGSSPRETLDIQTIGPFTINGHERSISLNGELIELTQKEFDLAIYLLHNVGRLLSRGHILEEVWGRSAEINTRTVDTHVSRLRNKLKLIPENGWRLNAIYQHGYRLEHLDVGENRAVQH